MIIKKTLLATAALGLCLTAMPVSADDHGEHKDKAKMEMKAKWKAAKEKCKAMAEEERGKCMAELKAKKKKMKHKMSDKKMKDKMKDKMKKKAKEADDGR